LKLSEIDRERFQKVKVHVLSPAVLKAYGETPDLVFAKVVHVLRQGAFRRQRDDTGFESKIAMSKSTIENANVLLMRTFVWEHDDT
jgi:hypothetical protein